VEANVLGRNVHRALHHVLYHAPRSHRAVEACVQRTTQYSEVG
jgi:hypothetical protein